VGGIYKEYECPPCGRAIVIDLTDEQIDYMRKLYKTEPHGFCEDCWTTLDVDGALLEVGAGAAQFGHNKEKLPCIFCDDGVMKFSVFECDQVCEHMVLSCDKCGVTLCHYLDDVEQLYDIYKKALQRANLG